MQHGIPAALVFLWLSATGAVQGLDCRSRILVGLRQSWTRNTLAHNGGRRLGTFARAEMVSYLIHTRPLFQYPSVGQLFQERWGHVMLGVSTFDQSRDIFLQNIPIPFCSSWYCECSRARPFSRICRMYPFPPDPLNPPALSLGVEQGLRNIGEASEYRCDLC
jgi:hypothetical protein